MIVFIIYMLLRNTNGDSIPYVRPPTEEEIV
jgi:hypothetical protein